MIGHLWCFKGHESYHDTRGGAQFVTVTKFNLYSIQVKTTRPISFTHILGGLWCQIQWIKLLICCRDASFGTCMYNLNILDCLRAVNKVFLLQIYSPFSPSRSPNQSPSLPIPRLFSMAGWTFPALTWKNTSTTREQRTETWTGSFQESSLPLVDLTQKAK